MRSDGSGVRRNARSSRAGGSIGGADRAAGLSHVAGGAVDAGVGAATGIRDGGAFTGAAGFAGGADNGDRGSGSKSPSGSSAGSEDLIGSAMALVTAQLVQEALPVADAAEQGGTCMRALQNLRCREVAVKTSRRASSLEQTKLKQVSRETGIIDRPFSCASGQFGARTDCSRVDSLNTREKSPTEAGIVLSCLVRTFLDEFE